MLRNRIFYPKNSRSVHVNTTAWKPSWLSLMTRKEFRDLGLRGGAPFLRSLLLSCLLSHFQNQSGQAGLCCSNEQARHLSGLPQGKFISCSCYMSPLKVCRGVLLTMDTWGLGLKKALSWHVLLITLLAGGDKAADHSLALEASTWKWHTEFLLGYHWSKQVMWLPPNFKSLQFCRVS